MTNLGLLKEESCSNYAGKQYDYTLTPDLESQLKTLEATPKGRALAAEMAPFEAKARELLSKDVRELEVAATITFFRKQGHNWSEAITRTCNFKGLKPQEGLLLYGEALAHTVVA